MLDARWCGQPENYQGPTVVLEDVTVVFWPESKEFLVNVGGLRAYDVGQQ